MKQWVFILLAATVALPGAAIAQNTGTRGLEFVEAVKKRDGEKALSMMAGRPGGIIDTRDGEGNTALVIAISRSDEQWTGFLLHRGADLNLGGKGGDTPLIAAARVGFLPAVEWLIALKAKVDATNRMGETPLIIAVQQRSLPIVRMLLDAGADPDRTDSAAGYSARDYAKRDARSREILKLIENRKPKPAK